MAEIPSNDRLIRLAEVLRIIPVGKSTWHQAVRESRAPRPVKIGAVSAWRLSDILSLIETGFAK